MPYISANFENCSGNSLCSYHKILFQMNHDMKIWSAYDLKGISLFDFAYYYYSMGTAHKKALHDFKLEILHIDPDVLKNMLATFHKVIGSIHSRVLPRT